MEEEVQKELEQNDIEIFNPYHVSENCIAGIGEQNGIVTLSSEIKQILSEDTTYRLRELVHNASHFMHFKSMQKLTSKYINRALYWSSSDPIFGHHSSSPLKFNYSKDLSIYYLPDSSICLYDIALESVEVKMNNTQSIEGKWICIEGLPLDSSEMRNGAGIDLDSVSLEYYMVVIESIFGEDDDSRKCALCDISSNPNISEVFPFFVSFMSSVISESSGCLLTQIRVLQMMEAFLENPNISILSTSYIEALSSTLLYCIVNLQDQKYMIDKHIIILKLAASGLAKVLKSPAAVFHPQIREYSLNTLICSITLPSSSLATLYGVFVFLQMLDPIDTISALWPVLSQLEKMLNGRKVKQSGKTTHEKIMFLNVLDSVKSCFCNVLKKYVKELTDEAHETRIDSHPTLISNNLNAYLTMLRMESDSGFTVEHDKDRFSFVHWYNIVQSICGESVLIDIPFTLLTCAVPSPNCTSLKTEFKVEAYSKPIGVSVRHPTRIFKIEDVFECAPVSQNRPFFKFNFVGAMPLPMDKLKYKSYCKQIVYHKNSSCDGSVYHGKILNLLVPRKLKWQKSSNSCSIFVNL